jgi:hypothetical protein
MMGKAHTFGACLSSIGKSSISVRYRHNRMLASPAIARSAAPIERALAPRLVALEDRA